MFRLAATILCLFFVPHAHAATIEGDYGMGCKDLAFQRRIDTLAGTGDETATTKLVQSGLDSRQCVALPNGLKVRIEENSFPYACVAKIGTISPCLWVRQRYVNPTN